MIKEGTEDESHNNLADEDPIGTIDEEGLIGDSGIGSFSKRVRKPSSAFRDFQDSGNLDHRALNAKVTKKKVRKSEEGKPLVIDDLEAIDETVGGSSKGKSTNKLLLDEKTTSKSSNKAKKDTISGAAPTTSGANGKNKQLSGNNKEKNSSNVLLDVGSTATTMKSKVVIDPKEKALDEAEEGLISRALRRKSFHSHQKKALPEGAAALTDMNAALTQSFLDISTPLCDWSIEEAKYIGCICKVYWDGEDKWFYSRILNYDPYHKKHYIFYFEDNTAEWISLESEAVMVAHDMKLVQWKSYGVWPALVYWVSPKAERLVVGSHPICVEFFNEKNQLEKHFAAPHHLHPLSVEFLPEKRSKKYEKCWEAAKSEKEAVDTVIDEVVRCIRSSASKLLKGDDWLGLRLRAPTHRILTKAEKRNQYQQAPVESAYCTGTVKAFCPLVHEYLIVFDEEQLQPQWVDLKGKVELLVGPTQLQVSKSAVCEQIHGSEQCTLCNYSCVDSDAVQCTQCQTFCHSYCIPPTGLRPLNEIVLKKGNWKCWKCCACHSCGITQWNTQLMTWNARRMDPTGPDRNFLLCGVCLNRFKHHKEFCTLCYKLYSDSPVLSQLEEQRKLLSEEAIKESGCSSCALGNDAADEQWMIQCNECDRWVHAKCEGIDQVQYKAISEGTHPIWGDEYLCPICRVKLSSEIIRVLRAYDKTFLFAEPVTTSVAANYFDIIRNPMDLSTMRGKSEKGWYKSLQAVRQDIELMCCNAFTFNRVGDEFWIATRTFYLQAMELFQSNPHTTVPSAYGKEAEGWLEKWEPPQTSSSKKRKSSGVVGALNVNEHPGKPEKAQKLEDGSKKNIPNSTDDNGDGKKSLKKKKGDKNNQGVSATNLSIIDNVDERNKKDENLEPVADDGDEGPQFISIQQVSNPDPPTFVTPFTSLLTAEEAVYSFCQDQCFACGSSGLSGNFLFCIDCGEAYHSFCALTPPSMPAQAKSFWRCVNCKICEVCGIVGEKDSETLVFCESCDQSFHIHCLTPALPSTPEFHWYCATCIRCQYCEDGGDGRGKSDEQSITDKHGNVLKAWSSSPTCCYSCDIENKYHMSMMAVPSAQDLQKNEGKTNAKKKVVSSMQGDDSDDLSLNTPAVLTCFDCGEKFNADAVVAAAALLAANQATSHNKRSHNSSAIVSNQANNEIDPYFWICTRCDRKKTHEWGCHLGDSREAQTLLKKIASIQSKRLKQIGALKSLALKSITEPLNVFRKCNGLYYLMMILWGSLRTSNVANYNAVVVVPTPASVANDGTKPSRSYAVGKLMKGTVDQLSSSTQWISARSRRYMNYSRRRIHRHESHPLHVVGDNRPVHLPSLLEFNTEAMARLAQMASTFLFTTENEQYSEEYQIRELVLVLIQVSFLLLHDSPTLPTVNSSPAAPIASTLAAAAPPTTAAHPAAPIVGGTPQFVGTTDLREELAKNVHDYLKSIYSKFGFGSNSLTIMDIMGARQMCRNTVASGRSALSAAASDGVKKKVDYVISHNFSSNEIIDIVATIMTTLATSVREFPTEYTDQICKFVEKSFSKVPIGGTRPPPTKRPVDLLNYFKSCKNPLISPGFIIPVDLFSSGNAGSVNCITTERVDGLFNANTMSNSVSSIYSAVSSSSFVKSTNSDHVQPWRPMGVNQGPLLSSTKHQAITFHLPSEATVAASAPTAAPGEPIGQEVVTAKSEYSNKLTELLSQVREEVQAICREEYENEQSYDGIDVKQIIEDMLSKYLEPYEQSSATAGESETAKALEDAPEQRGIEMDIAEDDDTIDKQGFTAEVVANVASTTTTPSTTCTTSLLPPTPSSEDLATVIVKPMKGWTSAMNPDYEWIDPRTCVFCGEDENDDNYILGRLLPFSDGAFVHTNCILWCQEVEEKNNVLIDAYNARDRVIRQHCYLCHKRGASLNCCQSVKKCRRAFHLKCALACDSLLLMKPTTQEASSTSGATTSSVGNDNDKTNTGSGKSTLVMTCPAHVDCVLKIKPTNKGRPSHSQYTHGSKSLVPWVPSFGDRCLMIERQEPTVELQTLSTVLAQRRNDKAAKSGAVTILNLGHPSVLDAAVFSTPSYIYPYGFRSSRIYWSMTQPGVRTVYLFEILSFSETEDWDLQQVEYLQDMLELMEQDDLNERERIKESKENLERMNVDGEDHDGHADDKLGRAESFFYSKPDSKAMVKKEAISLLSTGLGFGGHAGPLFRCIVLDNPGTPLFAKHLHQLYNYIMQGVETCNANIRGQPVSVMKTLDGASSSTLIATSSSMLKSRCPQPFQCGRYTSKKRSLWHGYGLTPFQFFGLGLPFTRYALEHIPDSIASMMISDNQSRYSPVYKLPSETEISAIQQLINSLKGNHHFNQSWNPTTGMMDVMNVSNGSTRADPYVAKYNGVSGTRLTRILTKVVENAEGGGDGGEGTSKGAEEEDDLYAADLEKEGNRAEIEARIQKFIDMSAAYMINPYAKLEVRKSPIHGWGLFAKMNFERDDVIVEYIGEKIRQVVADRREAMYEQNGVGSCYLFRLDKDEIIDATATGAMARFMNHCCEPNAYARIITFFKNDIEEKHIVIMAARDIQEGEEITYDYKFPIEDKKLKCYCGAPKCSGSMN